MAIGWQLPRQSTNSEISESRQRAWVAETWQRGEEGRLNFCVPSAQLQVKRCSGSQRHDPAVICVPNVLGLAGSKLEHRRLDDAQPCKVPPPVSMSMLAGKAGVVASIGELWVSPDRAGRGGRFGHRAYVGIGAGARYWMIGRRLQTSRSKPAAARRPGPRCRLRHSTQS